MKLADIAPLETWIAFEKDIHKAIMTYERALPEVSNKVAIYNQMATVFEKNGNYKEAIGVYDKILKINPNNNIAANNLSALLLDYGEQSERSRALDLAKGFSSIKQPAFQDTLGWAYVKNGEYQKAVEILESVVRDAPNIAVFQYHLGYALHKNNNNEKAKKHPEVAIDSDQKFSGKADAKALFERI